MGTNIRISLVIQLVLGMATLGLAQSPAVKKYNPAGVFAPRTYSQVAEVPPGTRLLFFSGMVAQDEQGNVRYPGELALQIRGAFENIDVALKGVGARWEDVVKLTYYVVGLQEQDLALLRSIRSDFLPTTDPPASTLVGVTALFDPNVRIEIEAIVALPAQ